MHQVLTPSGYRDAYLLEFGDEVCAFDMATGSPIINTLETKPQWVDAGEWALWHPHNDTPPPFRFIRINGTWLLNSEQSIWRNGLDVCHARHLVVGDIIYDDADSDFLITSIEEEAAPGWWRFDVSGDHSYIIDGLTVHNASRFWVGGTGDLDGVTTTHIAATSNGAGGASYPGSSDTMTWDGSSGAGTTTVTATHTLQSMTMGAFTGTWTNAVGNHNITVTVGAGNAFNGSGTATRTINLGSATYTVSGAASTWNFSTVTNLTFTGSSATVVMSNATGQKVFNGGGLTYGTVSLGAPTGAGLYAFAGANTIGTLTVTAPNRLTFPNGVTNTITTTNLNGTSSNQILVETEHLTSQATIAATTFNATYAAFRGMAFTGSPSATDSFNLGNNSGITITAPSSGGGAAPARVIGG